MLPCDVKQSTGIQFGWRQGKHASSNDPTNTKTTKSKHILLTKRKNMTVPASFNIENSVAFVTGTNKPNGIGSHIVRALLEHGAKKVYATARDESQLDYLVVEG